MGEERLFVSSIAIDFGTAGKPEAWIYGEVNMASLLVKIASQSRSGYCLL
jgi:hypothetical protein